MEKRLLLSRFDKHLWTRERGREVREELTRILEQLEPGDTLVVDAKDVDVFDYSFVSELFAKSLLSIPRDYPGRFLIVEHLKEYTRENLIKALESLNLIIIERQGGKLQLLGKVHPADEQTFSAVTRAKGSVTAAALRDKLGINLTALNERLTKLANLGIVRREKGLSPAGREQYVYWAPV
jgi:hypothetical protein